MGILMIRCPKTGLTMSTGWQVEAAVFRASPVFFSRTYCSHCRTVHEWFMALRCQYADLGLLAMGAGGLIGSRRAHGCWRHHRPWGAHGSRAAHGSRVAHGSRATQRRKRRHEPWWSQKRHLKLSRLRTAAGGAQSELAEYYRMR
jgi:hypothetical protein